MKKLVLPALLALVAAIAVPVLADASVKTVKKDSTITLEFVGDQYGGIFFGTVGSQSQKCIKGRKVTVSFTDAYGGDKVGSDKTDKQGNYYVQDESPTPAQYEATVAKKVIKIKKNNGDVKKKIVCKPATSNPIFAP